jgi:hypothetical protein
MKNARAVAALFLAGAAPLASGCGQDEGQAAEQAIHPNLPAVPSIPAPSQPITYEDGVYSVYGVRKRMRHTMDTEVRVKGWVVEVYMPEHCEAGRTCPPPRMPHCFLADSQNEPDRRKRLTVVGYAVNMDDIWEAQDDVRHNREVEQPPEGEGLPPIPTDLNVGNQVIVTGRFTRISGAAFLDSEGLVDYVSHEVVGTPVEIPDPPEWWEPGDREGHGGSGSAGTGRAPEGGTKNKNKNTGGGLGNF